MCEGGVGGDANRALKIGKQCAGVGVGTGGGHAGPCALESDARGGDGADDKVVGIRNSG